MRDSLLIWFTPHHTQPPEPRWRWLHPMPIAGVLVEGFYAHHGRAPEYWETAILVDTVQRRLRAERHALELRTRELAP